MSAYKQLLTADEIAAMLSVSKETIYNMNIDGRIPEPIQISSNLYRWDAEEINEWIDCGCPKRDVWEAMKGDNQ